MINIRIPKGLYSSDTEEYYGTKTKNKIAQIVEAKKSLSVEHLKQKHTESNRGFSVRSAERSL